MTLSFDLGGATALGLAVLVAKATLLLIAGLAATALLQRASAGSRHLVWVAMVAALLVLPALSAWGPWQLAILPAPLSPVVQVTPGAPVNEVAQGTALDPRRIPADPIAPSNDPLPAEAAPASVLASWSRWEVAVLVWGLVAAGLAGWLLLGFLSVRRIVRGGEVLTARDWTGPLYEIADRLQIEEAPRLILSDKVRMPFACGVVTPTIVLPAESSGWSAERRSAVLMHELAHIKRRDMLGHTLGRLACAVYWFHPLVWTAARRLRVESEKACDDLALTCGLRASTYAEHLLDIVSNIRQPHTPAAAIPMAHRREFEGRMLAILDPDLRRRSGRWQSLSLVGGLAALVVVVGAAAPAPRQVATKQLATESVRPASALNDSAVRPESMAAPMVREQQQASTTTTRTVDRQYSQAMQREESKATEKDLVLPPELAQLAQGRPADDRPILLMQVLRSDTSVSLRRVAAWGLSQHADREDVGTALATALRRDANAGVREMAAWALASGEDRKAVVDALIEALRRDSDSEVREMAAWTLGNLGAEDAEEALATALADSSRAMRVTALWALGQSSSSRVPRAAIDALQDKEPGVRTLAAWVLFQTEDESGVPALEAALNRETDKNVRTAYIRALGAIGEKAAPALARLIDSNDPDVRAVVVNALAGRAGGPWPMPRPRPRPNP
jgi:beta-lactamase regulating signal transducer with metallopeptidase domain/HEAT repeat protein